MTIRTPDELKEDMERIIKNTTQDEVITQLASWAANVTAEEFELLESLSDEQKAEWRVLWEGFFESVQKVITSLLAFIEAVGDIEIGDDDDEPAPDSHPT